MRIARRTFLAGVGAATAAHALPRPRRAGPPLVAVQSGDPRPGSAMIWARAAGPGGMRVEWSSDERMHRPTRVVGPRLEPAGGLCGAVELTGLPEGADVFYRVAVDGGEPLGGRLRVPGRAPRDLVVGWSADTCGQGWGINREWGGYRAYAALRRLGLDAFIHCGDQIYADNPLAPEVKTASGRVWRNVVTPAKSKVAETLDEFRGAFAYNLLDDHLRAFLAEVPQIALWDDHEVRNNWHPGTDLSGDDRYAVKDIALLAARAKQAFREHNAIRPGPIQRRLPLGPLAEIFVLDERSFRAANGPDEEAAMGPATACLGADQLAWLIDGLTASTATWKIIASDLPWGLVVGDGPRAFEAFAQGGGPPLGRELELAALLSALRARRVRNVIVVTADVHYAAAHRFDPARAIWKDFDPFMELVAGPLHAGTFSGKPLDPTFGPELVFQRAPPAGQENLAPWDGMQSFGTLAIAARTGALTARLHDGEGAVLWSTELSPAR